MLKFSTFFLSLICNFSLFAQTPQTNYKLDKAHSSITFKVAHMMISKVNGKFGDFDVWLSADKPDFSDAVISAKIKVASINTGVDMRDKHLVSTDLFDAEKFPEITFSNVTLKKKKGNIYNAIGDLTIKGVSKPATFTVEATGSYINKQGVKVLGFAVNTKISRKHFGLLWNGLGENVVGDEVAIEGEFEFVQQK